MQSFLASTSKRAWSNLSLRAATRTYATGATPHAAATGATSTPPLDATASAAATTATPLPGAAVLPEAFRAPSPSQSSQSSLSSTRTASPSSSRISASSPLRQQPYKLSVYSTRNNTILTLSTSLAAATATAGGGSSLGAGGSSSTPHVPIAWVSAGSAGYKGAARGTYDAAVEVSLRMFNKIRDLIEPPVLQGGQRQKAKGPKPTEIEVVWKGFGQGRDAVFRTLMGAEGDQVRSMVKRVTDATPIKIGGTRAKKRRVQVPSHFLPRHARQSC
ncbi:hypothetical protein JCM3766R1_002509 [Sporobolomyces carnicolor]